ncbi:hypothetical protein JHK85_018315 [Glycine max]|nr:hypothetical protein JHK85_018315 [Glycine max]
MSPVVTTSNSLVGKEGVGAPSELLCKTLYTWEEVVLLHLAMEWEGLVVKDSSVLETLGECLNGMAECGEGKERSKCMKLKRDNDEGKMFFKGLN